VSSGSPDIRKRAEAAPAGPTTTTAGALNADEPCARRNKNDDDRDLDYHDDVVDPRRFVNADHQKRGNCGDHKHRRRIDQRAVAPHLIAREAGGDTVNDKNFGEGVAWLGIILDESANSAARLQLSAQASRVHVYVIAADEERMIAEHTVKHIG
jgi:hypothetical protein